MRDVFKIAACILLFVAVVVATIRLDYVAYRARFPNAAPWTYLFQSGK